MARILFLAVCCLALLAQAPDRPAQPDEWGYRPDDGATVPVNPPALSWVSDGNQYRFDVQLSQQSDFTGPISAVGLRWSVYTHSQVLKPGKWFWRYRIQAPQAGAPAWSRARTFSIPANAVAFPQPTMDELERRIPKDHPRLFVQSKDLPRLRQWIRSEGREAFARLQARADALLAAEPTPEPTEMGSIRNPATVKYWWSNRMQTIKACQEAEVLAFAWLLSEDQKYAAAARRWVMFLASWNPDGPTNWTLNDEAAMPILHRLARAYDWAYPLLSEDDRARVRAALLRRALDCWKGSQTQEGAGHLNRPYNSHGNRSWHKLAENAVATFGETPESKLFLDFAVNKFFAAYPVWSDDDGGWHEGLSYWAGYMVKTTWWMDLARGTLGIDGFRKPFFAHFADYGLYTAPPGSPNMGFGDLAFRPPQSSWSFVWYFISAAKNPYWSWWARQWKMEEQSGEPVLGFLWGRMPAVEPKAPADLPTSKVFHGIGVAILNSTLLDAADNVQIRFKSSQMGGRSHGHDSQNSFAMNAYGDSLLMNNVYRDLHGSKFHYQWVHTTRAQNALLVNGEGQRPHSPAPDGRIVREKLGRDVDYVGADATAAYEGKLKKYLRHVVLVKPDLVILADEMEAARPSTFQWMLHGGVPFDVNEGRQQLRLERERAGVIVDYAAFEPLKMRQWTGYDPPPDTAYLKSVGNAEIPPQWHVEASTATPRAEAFTVTIIRPYRKGAAPKGDVRVERRGDKVIVRAAGKTITLRDGAEFVRVQGGR